jgi:hypothetical protein
MHTVDINSLCHLISVVTVTEGFWSSVACCFLLSFLYHSIWLRRTLTHCGLCYQLRACLLRMYFRILAFTSVEPSWIPSGEKAMSEHPPTSTAVDWNRFIWWGLPAYFRQVDCPTRLSHRDTPLFLTVPADN